MSKSNMSKIRELLNKGTPLEQTDDEKKGEGMVLGEVVKGLSDEEKTGEGSQFPAEDGALPPQGQGESIILRKAGYRDFESSPELKEDLGPPQGGGEKKSHGLGRVLKDIDAMSKDGSIYNKFSNEESEMGSSANASQKKTKKEPVEGVGEQKRGRGRPRKDPDAKVSAKAPTAKKTAAAPAKKTAAAPAKKTAAKVAPSSPAAEMKRPRGRPRKDAGPAGTSSGAAAKNIMAKAVKTKAAKTKGPAGKSLPKAPKAALAKSAAEAPRPRGRPRKDASSPMVIKGPGSSSTSKKAAPSAPASKKSAPSAAKKPSAPALKKPAAAAAASSKKKKVSAAELKKIQEKFNTALADLVLALNEG